MNILALREAALASPGTVQRATLGGCEVAYRVDVPDLRETFGMRVVDDGRGGVPDWRAAVNQLPEHLLVWSSKISTLNPRIHLVDLRAEKGAVRCRGGCGAAASTNKGTYVGFCSACTDERRREAAENPYGRRKT